MRTLPDSQTLDGHTPGSGGVTVIPTSVPNGTIDPWHERGTGIQPNGKVSFTIDEAAVQLTRSGTSLNGAGVLGQAATVTYAFRSFVNVMPDGTSNFSEFNAAQIAAAELALSTWSDVANITFVRVGTGTSGPNAYADSATILFGDYGSGQDSAAAFAYYPGKLGASSADSDVWVNNTLDYNVTPVVGDYGQQVLVHEIGHAIGLSHPSDYNAGDSTSDITYATDASYFEDSRQYSLMSYFGGVNTGAAFLFFSSVPMMDDIAAAQRLYGANMSARTGDTVYGFNSNADQPWFIAHDTTNSDLVFCVWDAGGHDTFDFSQYSTDALIDLRQGHFSSMGNSVGNVSIAQGVTIEDALSGAGNDLLIGNEVDNLLSGGAGNDTLMGGAGADHLDGGAGIDTATYLSAASGIQVDLGAGTGTGGDAQGDVLVGIENLVGSAYDDILSGDAGANVLTGGDGNDILLGGAGADQLDGGVGNNTASYQTATAGVSVDLGAATAAGSDAEGDVLTGIQNLIGSGYDDRLTGDAGANVLDGGAGNDVLDGVVGLDTMIGGQGDDTYFVGNAGDILVEAASAGIDSVMASVNFILPDNVENLTLSSSARNGTGNALDNIIAGNNSGNILYGMDGNDTIDGGKGADTMIGGNGNDTYYVDTKADTVVEQSGGGIDQVISWVAYTLAANVEKLTLMGIGNIAATGNNLNNTLVGNDGNNKLTGGAGNDVLNGGLGNDTLDGGKGADAMKGGAGDDRYYVDDKGDVITESSDSGNDTVMVNATYTLGENIENLVITGSSNRFGSGNALDNHLTGSAGNNTLRGLDGNDVIDGGKGADIMYGGQGDDTFYVDNIADSIIEYGNQGHDSVFTSVSLVLAGNVEDMTLTGSDNLNGTGNVLANVLVGNIGDNSLTGGKGADTLTGGAGADTFVFGPNSGADLITDFSAGDNDMIDVHAYHAQATAVITQVGADTVIDLGGGNVITVANTTFDDPAFTSHIVW